MGDNLEKDKFSTANIELISNKDNLIEDEKINQFFNELKNDLFDLDSIFEECDIIPNKKIQREDKWDNLINDILE